MISYSQALDIIQDEAQKIPVSAEAINLSIIGGRICAEDIISPLNVPAFDNSAMDGFALRLEDLSNKLTIKARVIAGDMPGQMEIFPGECCEIMTGAPVPEGANCIIPVEQAIRDGQAVSFSVTSCDPGYIRKAGSDFKIGATVIKAGTLLKIGHILPLAALGISTVKAYKKPKVAFIPTGREIVDQYDQPLMGGQIYNSSLPYALAYLTDAGVEAIAQPTIADDVVQFRKTLETLIQQKVNLIISSGAVSAGSHDFIRESLEDLGATILFHKVAIKPGKPVLFARLPNGTFYFGLPGNPVSTAVGLRFFVQPFLSALMRQPSQKPVFGRVKTPLTRKADLRLFLKANISTSVTGDREVNLLDGQESYRTQPFTAMNAWAVIPEYMQAVNMNDIIEILPLPYCEEGR